MADFKQLVEMNQEGSEDSNSSGASTEVYSSDDCLHIWEPEEAKDELASSSDDKTSETSKFEAMEVDQGAVQKEQVQEVPFDLSIQSRNCQTLANTSTVVQAIPTSSKSSADELLTQPNKDQLHTPMTPEDKEDGGKMDKTDANSRTPPNAKSNQPPLDLTFTSTPTNAVSSSTAQRVPAGSSSPTEVNCQRATGTPSGNQNVENQINAVIIENTRVLSEFPQGELFLVDSVPPTEPSVHETNSAIVVPESHWCGGSFVEDRDTILATAGDDGILRPVIQTANQCTPADSFRAVKRSEEVLTEIQNGGRKKPRKDRSQQEGTQQWDTEDGRMKRPSRQPGLIPTVASQAGLYPGQGIPQLPFGTNHGMEAYPPQGTLDNFNMNPQYLRPIHPPMPPSIRFEARNPNPISWRPPGPASAYQNLSMPRMGAPIVAVPPTQHRNVTREQVEAITSKHCHACPWWVTAEECRHHYRNGRPEMFNAHRTGLGPAMPQPSSAYPDTASLYRDMMMHPVPPLPTSPSTATSNSAVSQDSNNENFLVEQMLNDPRSPFYNMPSHFLDDRPYTFSTDEPHLLNPGQVIQNQNVEIERTATSRPGPGPTRNPTEPTQFSHRPDGRTFQLPRILLPRHRPSASAIADFSKQLNNADAVTPTENMHLHYQQESVRPQPREVAEASAFVSAHGNGMAQKGPGANPPNEAYLSAVGSSSSTTGEKRQPVSQLTAPSSQNQHRSLKAFPGPSFSQSAGSSAARSPTASAQYLQYLRALAARSLHSSGTSASAAQSLRTVETQTAVSCTCQPCPIHPAGTRSLQPAGTSAEQYLRTARAAYFRYMQMTGLSISFTPSLQTAGTSTAPSLQTSETSAARSLHYARTSAELAPQYAGTAAQSLQMTGSSSAKSLEAPGTSVSAAAQYLQSSGTSSARALPEGGRLMTSLAQSSQMTGPSATRSLQYAATSAAQSLQMTGTSSGQSLEPPETSVSAAAQYFQPAGASSARALPTGVSAVAQSFQATGTSATSSSQTSESSATGSSTASVSAAAQSQYLRMSGTSPTRSFQTSESSAAPSLRCADSSASQSLQMSGTSSAKSLEAPGTSANPATQYLQTAGTSAIRSLQSSEALSVLPVHSVGTTSSHSLQSDGTSPVRPVHPGEMTPARPSSQSAGNSPQEPIHSGGTTSSNLVSAGVTPPGSSATRYLKTGGTAASAVADYLKLLEASAKTAKPTRRSLDFGETSSSAVPQNLQSTSTFSERPSFSPFSADFLAGDPLYPLPPLSRSDAFGRSDPNRYANEIIREITEMQAMFHFDPNIDPDADIPCYGPFGTAPLSRNAIKTIMESTVSSTIMEETVSTVAASATSFLQELINTAREEQYRDGIYGPFQFRTRDLMRAVETMRNALNRSRQPPK